jgi:hypothetical protein
MIKILLKETYERLLKRAMSFDQVVDLLGSGEHWSLGPIRSYVIRNDISKEDTIQELKELEEERKGYMCNDNKRYREENQKLREENEHLKGAFDALNKPIEAMSLRDCAKFAGVNVDEEVEKMKKEQDYLWFKDKIIRVLSRFQNADLFAEATLNLIADEILKEQK